MPVVPLSQEIKDARKRMHSRLRGEGRFPTYEATVERFKAERRYSPSQAWMRVAQNMLPIVGPPEFHFIEDAEGILWPEVNKEGTHAPPGTGGILRVKVFDDKLATFEDLARLVDPKKQCTGHEAMDWVYNTLPTPWKDIDPDAVPSIGALGYLKWAKLNPKNEAQFYQMWSRMLEKRSNIDEESRRKDDGRKQQELIDDIEGELSADIEGRSDAGS